MGFSINSEFRKDATLVRQYTGVSLDRSAFDEYREQGTLRKELGSDRKIQKDYYGYGIPTGFSKIDVMNAVLRHLAARGVVFNIEEGGNEALFKTLVGAAQLCLTQDHWPRICRAYHSSPRLISAIRKLRSKMKLKELDTVL